MTFKLITDSTADLDESWAKDQDVEILGLHITLDGQVYETVGEKRLTSDLLLERMKNGSKPTTSQINVGQFEEAFRRHAEAGEAVLYLAFSSVLSGTYQSAVMAREMILEEFPEAIIEIVDTLAAAGGEGYLSVLAVEARDQGQSLEETKAMIEDILPRLRTYFLVDDLYHLMRGGRLSKGSAIIGSLVNIKPLLWIEADGKLVPIAKVRGRKKGIWRCCNWPVKTWPTPPPSWPIRQIWTGLKPSRIASWKIQPLTRSSSCPWAQSLPPMSALEPLRSSLLAKKLDKKSSSHPVKGGFCLL